MVSTIVNFVLITLSTNIINHRHPNEEDKLQEFLDITENYLVEAMKVPSMSDDSKLVRY